MRIAFAKHTLSFVLWAALCGGLACLTIPTASALADTGGSSAAASTATAGSDSPADGGTTAAPSSTTQGGSAATPAQTGRRTLATWFGPGFYGHETACGQTMSPALLGVASRTLPCGTLVQIGYHGHRLTVPVLDRGPYGHIGAVWDLTAGAARSLDIRETVRVTTAIVGSLPNTPTLGQPLEAGVPAEASGASPAAVATTATGGSSAS
jgi:rare lipoprotein A (peptidoglycan hydrolase)